METDLRELSKPHDRERTKQILLSLVNANPQSEFPYSYGTQENGYRPSVTGTLYEHHDRLVLTTLNYIYEFVTSSHRGLLQYTTDPDLHEKNLTLIVNKTKKIQIPSLKKTDILFKGPRRNVVVVAHRCTTVPSLVNSTESITIPEKLAAFILHNEENAMPLHHEARKRHGRYVEYYDDHFRHNLHYYLRDLDLPGEAYDLENRLERLENEYRQLKNYDVPWHQFQQRNRRSTLLAQLDVKKDKLKRKITQKHEEYEQLEKFCEPTTLSKPASKLAYADSDQPLLESKLESHLGHMNSPPYYVYKMSKRRVLYHIVGERGTIKLYPIDNYGDINMSDVGCLTADGTPIEDLPHLSNDVYSIYCFTNSINGYYNQDQYTNWTADHMTKATPIVCDLSTVRQFLNIPGSTTHDDLRDPEEFKTRVYKKYGAWVENTVNVELLHEPDLPTSSAENTLSSHPSNNTSDLDPDTREAITQAFVELERSQETPDGTNDGTTQDNLRDRQQQTPQQTHTSGLDDMIGLTKIKEQVRTLANVARTNQIRAQRDLPVMPLSLHLAFTGNPGTGKTEVARQIGRIYADLGILNAGHVVEVSRKDLVGRWVGHTATQTQEKINEAAGGVLFIDEAYTLAPNLGDSNDYGSEAIDTILKAMEDDRENFIVIVAGYPALMSRFLNSNPGLSSRFAKVLDFPDYEPDELLQIFELQVSSYGYSLTHTAKKRAKKTLEYMYNLKDETFGNARDVRTLVEGAGANLANRLATNPDPSHAELVTITEQDLPNPAPEEAEDDLKEALAELNALIGLGPVKEQINDLVDFMHYRKMRLAAGMAAPQPAGHLVFTGNPGTGKTTVARIISRIYAALGILKNGHLIETDRSGLVAGYVGQTALKVKDSIRAALGGALFIDEAYSITQSASNHDFGSEAIDTLVKEMEDRRDNLLVIAAGYPNEMEAFIDSNPGLRSRFTRTIEFPDYSPEELGMILEKISTEAGYELEERAKTYALEVFGMLDYMKHNISYGNGREARKLFEASIAAQAARLGQENKRSLVEPGPQTSDSADQPVSHHLHVVDDNDPQSNPQDDPQSVLERNPHTPAETTEPQNPLLYITEEDVKKAAKRLHDYEGQSHQENLRPRPQEMKPPEENQNFG